MPTAFPMPDEQTTANQVDEEANARKIAELQAQLAELERRTKPTRTSPEGSHHSGFDPIRITSASAKHNVAMPVPVKADPVQRPPGLEDGVRSEYGTPQGTTADLLGMAMTSATAEARDEHPSDWQVDTEGLTEKEINLRILKAIDRNTATSSHPLPHHRDDPPAHDHRHGTPTEDDHRRPQKNVPTIKITDESDFPDLEQAIKIKKSKKEKKKPPTPPSSSSSSTSSSTSSPSPRPDPTPQVTTSTPAVRVKEADSIKLSPLPEPPFWEGWRQQLYDDVGAASGVGHDIFQWLHVI